MNEQYAELITKFPLFEGHTLHGAQFILERGEVREHPPGEVLCREGDPADLVLLVLSGKVQVFAEQPNPPSGSDQTQVWWPFELRYQH